LSFTDLADAEGLAQATLWPLSFGLFFFDYDLDGRLDLLQANGHLEDQIGRLQAGQTYRQPAQLFWNREPGPGPSFIEVPADRTGDLSRPIVGRAAAFADIDADADLDVLLGQAAGSPLLLRNDQRLGHHWLRVDLESGIGAWVVLRAGGVEQRQQIMPTRSYLSQVEPSVTFGLGQLDRIEALEVIWPGNVRQSVPPPAVDTVVRLERASR
jgi:hypothetical protein